MAESLNIAAELRSDAGKGASRRLRREQDKIPAIIYGAGRDPQNLSIVRKDIEKQLENEAFFSQIINVNVDGDIQQAILKDLQRHPAKDRVMHADFLRIEANVALKVNIPVHLVNEDSCVGVRNGGILELQSQEIEVRCLPGNIPEYIEVDVAALDLGDNVHLSDLKLPEGVVSTALELGEDHDELIVMVASTRGGASAAPTDDDSDAGSDEAAEGGEGDA